MTISVAELRKHVGSEKSSDEQMERNLQSAISLMDTWLRSRKNKVPDAIYDTCLLGVAQQLYYRDTKDTSSSGQYSPGGDFVATVVKDPMHYAYPLLRKYVGWF